MRDALRRLKIGVAWRLLDLCYWGEQFLWKRYDQDFVVRYIMPDLDHEIEEPPELVEAINPDIDDVPF